MTLAVYHAAYVCEALRSGVNTVPVGPRLPQLPPTDEQRDALAALLHRAGVTR